MPYRYAHYVILTVLVPAILVAFWPGYFGVMTHAPFALHAHGLTASLWILLVVAQSWTAHARRLAWHRAIARGVLAAVPLFAASAMLVVHSMAAKFVAKSDPFNATLGARLGLDDLLTTIVFVAMAGAAVLHRRRVGLHAAYMLSTVLLVLPPVVARLPLPGAFFGSYALSVVLALGLYVIRRRDGKPFLMIAAFSIWRVFQFETIGASDAWAGIFTQLAGWPATWLALAGFVVGAAAIGTAWPWQRANSKRPLAAG